MTQQKSINPTMALLAVLTAMMTVTILALIYLIAFVDPERQSAAPPGIATVVAAPGPPRCDASSLETMTCPPGQYCNIDTCVKIEEDPECGEGQSCRDCDCKTGLVCHHNSCIDPKLVERVPLVCQENERLSQAVHELVELCRSRNVDPEKVVSTGTCSIADWEALALSNEKFDLLLAAFPNRFAVHFPSGQPNPRREWPTIAERDYVLAQIGAYREALASSKQIFVIGRASPDGDVESNHVLALARMQLVTMLIDKAVHAGMTPTESAAVPLHTRSFTLPTTRPIRPEKYEKVYLKNPPGTPDLGLDPLMAWDERSLKGLKSRLADTALINEIGSPEYAKLLNEINRVVLVIPIPCSGDEFKGHRNDIDEPAAAAVGGAP